MIDYKNTESAHVEIKFPFKHPQSIRMLQEGEYEGLVGMLKEDIEVVLAFMEEEE